MTRWRTRPRAALPGVEVRERVDAQGAYWVFRVRWKDPATGRRLVETCDSPQDALDFRANLRLLSRRGGLEDLDRGRETLTSFAAEWFEAYAAGNLAHTTLKSYASCWNKHLLPRIGALQLRQITPKAVESLKQQMLTDGVGAPTVHRCLALLQAMFREAVIWDRATVNPVRMVSKPQPPRQRVIEALTVRQVEHIISWLREHRNAREAVLVELMAYSGARPQDALALTWMHVGTERLAYVQKNVNGRILPGAKTGAGKHRDVGLLRILRADLREHRLAMGNPAGHALLVPNTTGKPWTKSSYANWMSKGPTKRAPHRQHTVGAFQLAAISAGVPGITPYSLRHTYASLRLAEQRLSLKEIADELGHSVDVLARDYSHVISDLRGKGPIDPDQLIRQARHDAQQRRSA